MDERKEINAILGGRVRAARQQAGYTREKLAELISVSARFLADVESGSVGVSLSTLTMLCRCLNVSADYLLGLSDGTELDRMRLHGMVDGIGSDYLAYAAALLSTLAEIENDIGR